MGYRIFFIFLSIFCLEVAVVSCPFSQDALAEPNDEAPRSKAARYQAEFFRSRIPSFARLRRASEGLFSSPSSPQQAAGYSAKENKKDEKEEAEEDEQKKKISERNEFARLTVDGTVAVRSSAGGGAGFAIAPKLVVTAGHLIKSQEEKVKVRLCRLADLNEPYLRMVCEGKSLSARCVFLSKDLDLAVIELDERPENLKILTFGDSSRVSLGQEVWRFGQDDRSAEAGHVLSFGNNPPKEIQLSISARAGSSGGPVVDMNGRVIGMVLKYQSSPRLPDVSYILPSNKIRETLKEAGIFK